MNDDERLYGSDLYTPSLISETASKFLRDSSRQIDAACRGVLQGKSAPKGEPMTHKCKCGTTIDVPLMGLGKCPACGTTYTAGVADEFTLDTKIMEAALKKAGKQIRKIAARSVKKKK